MKGTRTTCGSRILERFEPPYDATVIEKLREAGPFLSEDQHGRVRDGVFDREFSVWTHKEPMGPRPHARGSSGGSAAAVARTCARALWHGHRRLIRQPASFCGVVGFRTQATYGRVSRFGLVAFASSLTRSARLTKDVEDAAILLQAIAGYDPRDSTSVDLPVPDYRRSSGGRSRGCGWAYPGSISSRAWTRRRPRP